MLRKFEGVLPMVASSSFIDESAVVIGDVVIGENSSVRSLRQSAQIP